MMQSQEGQSCVMHDDVKHEEPASSPSLCGRQERVSFKHQEISHTSQGSEKIMDNTDNEFDVHLFEIKISNIFLLCSF